MLRQSVQNMLLNEKQVQKNIYNSLLQKCVCVFRKQTGVSHISKREVKQYK